MYNILETLKKELHRKTINIFNILKNKKKTRQKKS